ncbi:MAG: alkaline phosphatase D family protein [Myxococcales bacterium]|nr:alkaline phosphatase D family protein [Myxococcales bacterium]
MYRHITRRSFVSAAAAAAITSSVARAHRPQRGGAFRHGVASGDPLHDRVVLWTRVTPANPHDDLEVKWRIARDPAMRRVIDGGRAHTNIFRDFTVKVDVDRLEPGRTYYFQFSADGDPSPIGRTRTTPNGRVGAARLALASCSNLPAGLFNVYALIARRNDLDAVLHLGDYLYEYANASFGDGVLLDRVPMPDREILTLADYRQRHAQYKSDVDSQAAHRQHPFICVWDDHEIANDAWTDGAENHDVELGEGEWSVRKRAAIRAYFEWMPIREFEFRPRSRIFRQFRFGNLVDLLMLDTRHFGRDRQSTTPPVSPTAGFPANDPVANDPARSLLGLEQEAWLDQRLVASQARGTTWRLLGQQVMMAQLSPSGGQTLFNLDQWDGYIPARERLFTSIRDNAIDNVVVLTGDIHSSWANELTSNPWSAGYHPGTGAGAIGVEFVTPAVSSPGILNPVEAAQTAAFVRSVSPHMKFVELNKRGYVVLDIDRERLQGEFWHAATVATPSRDEALAAAFATEAGANHLVPVSGASAARVQADPAS